MVVSASRRHELTETVEHALVRNLVSEPKQSSVDPPALTEVGYCWFHRNTSRGFSVKPFCEDSSNNDTSEQELFHVLKNSFYLSSFASVNFLS